MLEVDGVQFNKLWGEFPDVSDGCNYVPEERVSRANAHWRVVANNQLFFFFTKHVTTELYFYHGNRNYCFQGDPSSVHCSVAEVLDEWPLTGVIVHSCLIMKLALVVSGPTKSPQIWSFCKFIITLDPEDISDLLVILFIIDNWNDYLWTLKKKK